MNGPAKEAVPLQIRVHGAQAVKTRVHGKAGELPLNDTGKPHKGPHVIKENWPVGFLRLENAEPRRLKDLALLGQVQVGKGLLQAGQDPLHQIPVVVRPHLLREKDASRL